MLHLWLQGNVSQDDIIESARRLLDLVTSSERHRGAEATNQDMRFSIKLQFMYIGLTFTYTFYRLPVDY